MLTRRLEWTPRGGAPRPIDVRIEPTAESARLTIEGFDAPVTLDYPGRDPLEAVLLASWAAPGLLRGLARGGRVTWEGRGVGLLPPWWFWRPWLTRLWYAWRRLRSPTPR